MHYSVTMKYKDITAETMVEAGSEKEAIDATKQLVGAHTPFGSKYPKEFFEPTKDKDGKIVHKRVWPEDVAFTVNAIPEPDPVDEVASLEAEKAAIEARLVEARGKVATMEKSRA